MFDCYVRSFEQVNTVQHVSESPHVPFFVFVKLAVTGAHGQRVGVSTRFYLAYIIHLGSAVTKWRDASIIGVHLQAVLFHQYFQSLNISGLLSLRLLFFYFLFFRLDVGPPPYLFFVLELAVFFEES
jgi:hypothetical protein